MAAVRDYGAERKAVGEEAERGREMNDNPLTEVAVRLAEILRKLKESFQAIIAIIDILLEKKPLSCPQKKILPRYAALVIRPLYRAMSTI